jgi:RNA polymerase sigma factor (sigma-70 family)
MQVLTENQREVLILRFGMDMSHREIAERTGRNEEAIRALQFRAISSLRDVMAEDTD